ATGSAMEGVAGADPVHPGWTARQRRGIAALLGAMTLLAAVALRFWRLSWGLANGEFFPDELIFSGRAAAFVPLSWASFDLHDFLYPTLYGYLAGAATAIAHALGVLPAPGRYPPGAILMARIVSAAAGVLTVGLVSLAAFGATFLAACPPCLLHLDQVRAALRLQYVLTRAMPWGFGNNYLTPTLGWYGRPYCYELVASFPFTLGWPLYALALAG